MLAFAGNSVLCRLALRETSLDAASFTGVRLIAGAAVLWLLTSRRSTTPKTTGNYWPSLALFVYAAGFSFAYIQLSTATGALILFGAVQATMMSYDYWQGARFHRLQIFGVIIALIGLVYLLLPSIAAPPISSAALMLLAGIAWGIYSLLGKNSAENITARNSITITAGNFSRAIPLTILLSFLCIPLFQFDLIGLYYALASGALTSGLGYALWYSALPQLTATKAASVQLTVPMLAAIGGIVFLGETMSIQLLIASIAILSGVGLVISKR